MKMLYKLANKCSRDKESWAMEGIELSHKVEICYQVSFMQAIFG